MAKTWALAVAGVAALMGCADGDRSGVYRDLAADLEARGHLRTDAAPADAPFTAEDLTRAFERVAFSYEFTFRDGRKVEGPIARPLKRWQGTVGYRLIGDGVREADRLEIAALFDRLATLTGLTFRVVTAREHMLISIATPEGRREISQGFADAGQDVYRVHYDTWRRSPGWTCGAVTSVSTADPNRLMHAHIFLGAEAKGIIRSGCLHEEIVQALGLTDDDPDARPSIFNDDQEFALLTMHDELLLRVLYDPRLQPGMSAAEAVPIARRLFAELTAANAIPLYPVTQ
ncbi:MAG: DUF2927 domain-containing protein [Pseudomonadota bacterium]